MGLFKDCGCGCKGKKQEDKFIISIISALTFFVVANPATFRFVRGILGSRIASSNGCSTTFGLIVHSIVFMLIVWGMMNIKKDGPSCSASAAVEPVKEEKKKGTKIVVPVAEAPSPEPGFKEPELATKTDTGKVLEPFEIGVDGGLFN
jgi:hypothetical protein|tara:strand:- start:332 stop:775 length:444 start_codon:yes stop_codon:yes gene_type:complete